MLGLDWNETEATIGAQLEEAPRKCRTVSGKVRRGSDALVRNVPWPLGEIPPCRPTMVVRR